MNETVRLFTEKDYRYRACSLEEIGTVWEDRWTFADVADDLCSETDMGRLKSLKTAAEVEAEAEAELSGSTLERELAAYHKDPERYRISSASNLNKLLDYELRKLDKPVKVVKTANQMNMEELYASIREGMEGETFFTLAERGIDHIAAPNKQVEVAEFKRFLRACVK